MVTLLVVDVVLQAVATAVAEGNAQVVANAIAEAANGGKCQHVPTQLAGSKMQAY